MLPHHGRAVAKALGLTGPLAKEAEDLTTKLYRAFTAKDMSMLEINPLIVTKDGHLKCLDAKISFDSNSLYRHPEIVQLRDITEEDEKEIEASKYDLAYIALDGTIGCMVNGAGLAMATSTSSSSTARSRRTSSMSAAAPRRRRSPRPSRSSPPTRT